MEADRYVIVDWLGTAAAVYSCRGGSERDVGPGVRHSRETNDYCGLRASKILIEQVGERCGFSRDHRPMMDTPHADNTMPHRGDVESRSSQMGRQHTREQCSEPREYW